MTELQKLPRQRRSSTPTMPILLPTSSSSFKTTAAFVVTGVLSVAAAVSLTVPSVSHLVASSVPTVFLLKPPYLYLLINCIIVSIVATSKLAHKSSAVDDSDVVTPLHEPCHDLVDTHYYLPVASHYTGLIQIHDDAPVDRTAPQVITEDKLVVDAKQPDPTSDSRKPPRLAHHKSLQGGGSGNKKTPRKQDTLETTWSKITEGRSTPLSKRLTKSDTWQERTQHVQSREKLTMSDHLNAATDDDQIGLNRQPSPGQEELNRRVEAFINKFNQEMRLQRLQSLATYNELVNGGTPL